MHEITAAEAPSSGLIGMPWRANAWRRAAARGIDTRTLQAFMGHRSIANTVVYTSVVVREQLPSH